MKLLTKYNRASMVATIVVLLISAVVYYFFINNALIRQLDKSLIAEETEINEYVKTNHQLPDPEDSKDEQEQYAEVTVMGKRNFKSVLIANKKKREVYYRQLEFPVAVSGKYYMAVVRKSQEETEHLVRLILKITLLIVLLLLITLYLVNRFLLSRLWQPFYNTLQQLQKFNIASRKNIRPEPTNTTEFRELNNAVSDMTQKAVNDYEEIKRFTENASHEIQTPLAIIASKLELLNQTNLDENQSKYINSIADTTSRLSKLNQSLILLTKIDNRQFSQSGKINLAKVIETHLSNFEELLHAKNIILTKYLPDEFVVEMNETLADVLILNLITNAIKHNEENGSIYLELNDSTLKIMNTGKPPETSAESYFERFKKGSPKSESLGLGLSIVKKICDVYNFKISYNFHDGKHSVVINF